VTARQGSHDEGAGKSEPHHRRTASIAWFRTGEVPEAGRVPAGAGTQAWSAGALGYGR